MNAALPEGLDSFLGDTRWDGAEIVPLVGDASFRRYFRLRMGDRSAMLMHAPPPEEDTGPFLHVARWLTANGMRGPEIFGARAEEGLVLIEDFGDQRMKEWIDDHPEDESAVYAQACRYYGFSSKMPTPLRPVLIFNMNSSYASLFKHSSGAINI